MKFFVNDAYSNVQNKLCSSILLNGGSWFFCLSLGNDEKSIMCSLGHVSIELSVGWRPTARGLMLEERQTVILN